MFELQIALKYLLPKRRSLSTALISGLSVFVISLVVWLVLVFLSVLAGIEKNWLNKLTAIHAPIRISPTDVYYESYYYQIDSLVSSSNYTLKTIGEKAETLVSDPYIPSVDAEIPPFWQPPDYQKEGELKDLVKIAFHELSQLGLAFQDYEVAGALLRIQLEHERGVSYLSQMSYLLSISEKNPQFSSLISDEIDLSCQGGDVPIFLPKHYKESKVSIGGIGSLNYTAPSLVSNQEHKIGVKVAGFYDPGVLTLGNKCILVPKEVIRAVSNGIQTFSPDGTPTNGIFVWIENLEEAHLVKEKIEQSFEKAGIGKYWKVATFEEFEFSKDLLMQFRSDRILFLLIAAILLIVACSNIISLLVLLVNDKKKEIAILQSMGASFRSIAAIFGICGVFVGLFSCLFGLSAAILTLRHLDSLVGLLSSLQGRAAFNPAFFGQSLPNQLSWEGVYFVWMTTPLLCLIAGLIPAIKASRYRPSSILRNE